MIEIPAGVFGDKTCGSCEVELEFSEVVAGLFSSLTGIDGVGGADIMGGSIGVDGACSGRSSGVVLVTRATEPRSALT